MNRFVKVALMLSLALAIVLPLAAQEKEKKKKAKQQKGGSPVAGLVKQLEEKADLSADQKAKLTALAEETEAKVAKLREKLGDKQREIAAARKEASSAGKKGKELKEAVDAAVDLSEEQKAALQQMDRAMADFREAAGAILTPEQREKAGLKEGKKKKKNQ